MGKRGPSHASPYGLACQTCFKAKCKCVARTDGDGCQRCHRLNKQCFPSESLRRRTIDKKQASTGRIADLESKLTSLISQLQSRNVLDDQRTSDPSLESTITESVQSPDNQLNDGQDIEYTEDDDIRGSDRWDRSPEAISAPQLMQLSDAEVEESLVKFRSLMLPQFAFLHLPPELTADQMRRGRPFVLRSIICVMSATATERKIRSRELKTAIGSALLGQVSQSDTYMMDLLLGLLIYISWGWDHVLNHCSLSRLMMQAMSLACEMRLDKPTPQDVQMMALFTPSFTARSDAMGAVTTQVFLERQRAILGCFTLSSAVSSYFGEIDALRWTSQMEDGLAAISMNRDCPTDVGFALQVRLQLLAQKTVQVQQQHQMEQGHSVTESAALPTLMSIATIQGQLQELQTSLSLDFARQNLIMAHIHATDLRINEATHAINAIVPLMVSHFAMMTSNVSMSISNGLASARRLGQKRSQSLWQCVCAIKACTEALLNLTPVEFASINFLQWAQLARCVVVLNYLTTTIEDPAWDRASVRAHVDMPVLLGRIIEKLKWASHATAEHGPDEVFTQLAHRMHGFLSDMTGTIASDRRAAEDEDAALARSRHYGGVGVSGPVSMRHLAGI